MITIHEQMEMAFEELDLSYEMDTEAEELEISAYSPEGQDCFVTFNAKYMKDLLRDMAEWLYDYDADYEASLWIGDDGHGKNGAPYHIADIVADMEWWHNQIDTLHDKLVAIDQQTEYAYEVCPHCGAESEVIAEMGVQRCSCCGKAIVICSMCENQVDCRNCEWVKIAREMNKANE